MLKSDRGIYLPFRMLLAAAKVKVSRIRIGKLMQRVRLLQDGIFLFEDL